MSASLVDYFRVAGALGLGHPDVMNINERRAIDNICASRGLDVGGFARQLRKDDLQDVALAADDAAREGDSVMEVTLLREALEIAMALLDLRLPEPWEPDPDMANDARREDQ